MCIWDRHIHFLQCKIKCHWTMSRQTRLGCTVMSYNLKKRYRGFYWCVSENPGESPVAVNFLSVCFVPYTGTRWLNPCIYVTLASTLTALCLWKQMWKQSSSYQIAPHGGFRLGQYVKGLEENKKALVLKASGSTLEKSSLKLSL